MPGHLPNLTSIMERETAGGVGNEQVRIGCPIVSSHPLPLAWVLCWRRVQLPTSPQAIEKRAIEHAQRPRTTREVPGGHGAGA